MVTDMPESNLKITQWLIHICLFFICAYGVYSGEIQLKNSGFELDLDTNNVPDDWISVRRPVYDITGLNAHLGSRSAKVNELHFYAKELNVIGGSHYTFSCWAKGETDWDWGAIDVFWLKDSSPVEFIAGRVFPVSQRHIEYLDSFLAPHEANTVMLYLRSAWVNSWLWLDDCKGYNEFIENGSFEEYTSPTLLSGWQTFGYPIFDCTGLHSHTGNCAVLVDTHNYLFQPIAVSSKAKTYLLSFWARSDSAISTAFSIEWYDENNFYLSSSVLEFSPATEYAQFIYEIIPPNNAILGKFMLKPEPPCSVWVDDVTLSWHTAMPCTFSPNNDGVYDTTKIIYSVSHPSTVTLTINQPSGLTVKVLEYNVHKNKSVSEISWDGTDEHSSILPDGDYVYRIVMQDEYSQELIMQSEIEINTTNIYSSPTVNQFTDFFPRGVWIYSGGVFESLNYDTLFKDLKNHNINAVILNWIPESRYIDALTAGETYGIKCILHAITLNTLIEEYLPYQALPESLLRQEVEYLKDHYSIYDSLLGYYIIDEPDDKFLSNVFMVNTVMNDIDPAHPGFSAIQHRDNLLDVFETIRPSVLLFYYYPLPISSRARPEDFDTFIQDIESISQRADSLGLPFWLIVMGYAPIRLHGLPTPEEMRCQMYLAIACGVKGIFYFMYQSSGGIIGLTDYELNPTERYEALGRLFAELKTMESLFLKWRRTTPWVTSSLNYCEVRTFVDDVGINYIVVVNKDCINPAFPRLTLHRAGITEVRDVRGDFPIAFNTDTSQTYIDLEILPGDARILEVK